MHTDLPTPRLSYAERLPAPFNAYLKFSQSVPLDEGLRLLVDVRASQLNGCTFCLDMHVKQARLHGERELRLHHVAAWHDSPLFTPRERAALAWTEALTQLAPGGVPDALFDAVRAHFDEDDLVALTYQVMVINGWNRINVALRSTPGTMDKLLGLERAGL